jgi:hypothetical protein
VPGLAGEAVAALGTWRQAREGGEVMCGAAAALAARYSANRPATEFARGDRAGVLIIRMPLPESTSSDAGVNLMSRPRIKNLTRPAPRRGQ